MKILSTIFFSLFVLFLHAQESGKGLFLSFKGGYSIPVANSTIGSPRSEVGNRILVSSEEGTYNYSEKNPFGSRGAGASFSGSLGYMFSDHLGVEFEVSFLRSTKILDGSRDETIIENTFSRNYFAEQYSYTNMLRVSPMLIVSGNPNKKFIPYAKMGILLPLAGKTIVEVNISDKTGQLAEELLPVINPDLSNELNHLFDSLSLDIPIPADAFIKAKTAGAFSLGFTSKIGCAYAINDKWQIFGELEMNMLTIKAKETKFTEANITVSDAGLLALAETLLGKEIQADYGIYDLPEILRLTTYQNELTENSNSSYNITGSTYNRNAPYEQVTFRDNYNSFGLQFGVKYKFK
jgi:opacity protein-like surface antigen